MPIVIPFRKALGSPVVMVPRYRPQNEWLINTYFVLYGLIYFDNLLSLIYFDCCIDTLSSCSSHMERMLPLLDQGEGEKCPYFLNFEDSLISCKICFMLRYALKKNRV